MKWNRGDKIVYKGTKCGSVDSDWERFFGNRGIVKGSTGIIKEIISVAAGDHYFIEDDGRNTSMGYLLEEDFTIPEIDWKEELK